MRVPAVGGRPPGGAVGQTGDVPPLDDALARLHRLAERDHALGEELGRLLDLAERTADVRARADEVVTAIGRLPAERTAGERARSAAEDRAVAARAALAEAVDARKAASRARRDRAQRLAEAEAGERAAREGLTDAEANAGRLEREAAALEARDAELRVRERELRELAAALAGEVAAARRVAGPEADGVPVDLADLDEWGVRARAALLVARGSVEGERERLVAEANAVGSAVLGEDVGALGVRQVIRRLERAAGPAA